MRVIGRLERDLRNLGRLKKKTSLSRKISKWSNYGGYRPCIAKGEVLGVELTRNMKGWNYRPTVFFTKRTPWEAKMVIEDPLPPGTCIPYFDPNGGIIGVSFSGKKRVEPKTWYEI